MSGTIKNFGLDAEDEPSPQFDLPVYDCLDYAGSFEWWDVDQPEEPDGIYQPFPFTIRLAPEQEKILLEYQQAYSRKLIVLTAAYIDFYQKHPRPQSKRPKGRKSNGKTGKSKELKAWEKVFGQFYNAEKKAMTAAGWPGRIANELHRTAQGKIKQQAKLVKRALNLAEKKQAAHPSNHAHSKVQHWRANRDCRHICLGDRKALKEVGSLSNQLRRLEAFPLDPQTKILLRIQLEMQRNDALQRWRQSRVTNIKCSGGKDEGFWLNKTVFLRPAKTDPQTLELVIKYPKFLKPGPMGRELPKMVVPVKISDRSKGIWETAIQEKKALTFTLQPHKPERWRVSGVYKEQKVAKFAYHSDKRLGIDQNAGFITVALIKGLKLVWVRKYQISQNGTKEQHEARITEVMKELCEIARLEGCCIVIEDLSLAAKVKSGASKRSRRHIARIPYRRLQDILGRTCCRTGATLRVVNPANTSIDARYRLPGMNVHLGAAAMIAWRDIGQDQIEIFQVGKNCLKIQGEDSPLLVEVREGMPLLQRKLSDPRQRRNFYRFLRESISPNARKDKEQGASKERMVGRPIAGGLTHGRGGTAAMPRRRTVHEQMRPAAGAGPLAIVVRLKPTSKLRKTCPSTG